ncbi:unnamed protein product [Prorocentrum cordatum]|uniref:Uncharacterized protein n=1 Tax=Prorocentrum cordatum TaxID=2364126 RepID=A0ABN9SYQ2_9DINO|nr:unnamed protein product [Polarella glacialis]
MLSGSTTQVMTHRCRHRVIQPQVGAPEGRKLSPVLSCLATSAKAEDLQQWAGLWIGLDLALDALHAYRAARGPWDVDELWSEGVDQWCVLLAASATWEHLASAFTDAVRVAMAGVTTGTSAGTRPFVQDIPFTASSRGHCVQIARDAQPVRGIDFVDSCHWLSMGRDGGPLAQARLRACAEAGRTQGRCLS